MTPRFEAYIAHRYLTTRRKGAFVRGVVGFAPAAAERSAARKIDGGASPSGRSAP